MEYLGVIIFTIFVFSVPVHVIMGLILVYINEDWPMWYTPATFYELTHMNWFGCIIVWILLFPFTFVFETGGLLKWLFTVGRKD